VDFTDLHWPSSRAVFHRSALIMKAFEGYGHSFHDCYVGLISRSTCAKVLGVME
jgi:hypothetical protein